MKPRVALVALTSLLVIFQFLERTYANPYGYYAPYSRSRRDPTAWSGAAGYGGVAQPNPVPLIPNAMGGMPYGGRMDNQGMGMAGSYGQQDSMYGGNQYGSMSDTSGRNSLLGRMDAASQRGSPDLGTYQQQPQHYPSQLGGVGGVSSDKAGGDSPDPSGGCATAQCEDLSNCIDVAVNDTACCPTCTQYGCTCEGYALYDCQQNGYESGMVPEGKSYTVADGSTVCTCPPGGGYITCSFRPATAECPEVPENCVKSFVRSLDGCTECSMVGCTTESGEGVEAGMTVDKPPCSKCYCPLEGGEFMCGVDPNCESKLKQGSSGNLAMESTIREINSMGSEANLYGGYNSYGGYPDYSRQFGSQNPGTGGGSAPVIPPVMALPDADSGTGKEKKQPTDGQSSSSSDSAAGGYQNPYGSYPQRQGYNSMGYQGMYNQYNPYGQGYGGSYTGYDRSYGYGNSYGNSYGQTAAESKNTPGSDSTTGEETDQTQTGTGTGNHRQPGQYGYPVNSYGQYDQAPYVPPYDSYLGQRHPSSEDTSSKDSSSSETESDSTETEPASDSATGQSGRVGSQGLGYPYQGYGGQGGYYQSDPYGQFGQGYPFQPQLPSGTGQAASTQNQGAGTDGGSDDSSDSTANQPNKLGSSGRQGYPTGSMQYYRGYDGYGNYGFGSQYNYPHQQPPGNGLGTGYQLGSQTSGQTNSDPNAVPSIPERMPLNPSAKEDKKDTGDQTQPDGVYQPNYPYYPYDSQSRNPYSDQGPPQQPGVMNPSLMQPIGPTDDVVQPKIPSEPPQLTRGPDDRQSRRSRHNLSVVNKGRLSHERAISTTTSKTTTTTATTTKPTTTTTTTTKPTTTTTTTTTPKPTTTTTTPKPTTTTTTPKPTTTTTTTTTTPKPTTTTTTTTTPKSTTTTTTTTPKTTTTTPPTTTRKSRAKTSSRRRKTDGVSFESVLTGCCERGRQWATGHDTCAGITTSVGGTYSQICSVAQEKCCQEAKSNERCTAGMNTAQSLQACEVPSRYANTCGANEFQMCCDCCEMGLKAQGLGLSCDARIFGDQCNAAYEQCCRNQTSRENPKLPASTTTERSTTTTTSPETTAPGPRCATHSTCPQLCADSPDGMVCLCKKGYRLAKNKRDCIDVNECILNSHTCTEHQLCINREGSYFCQRRISCGTGYELTGENTCRDIDECELGIHDCLPSTDCDNVRGSYRCVPKLCSTGYITDATGRCIDINECRTRDYSCPRGASCVNTDGSYECQCPIGLQADSENTACEDIDECETGSANCNEGATCVNTVGSFVCRDPPKLRCAPGYEINASERTCIDIDECTVGTHTCELGATCINEDGGYRCQDALTCPDGMKPDSAGRICLDINECDDPTMHSCDVGGRCLNLARTFKCICNSGFKNTVTDDGKPTCKDINECELSDGYSCTYGCRNLPGSYECTCPEGYKLDSSGTGCEDIDECAQHRSPCSGSETCFNTQGSYRCVDLSCPPGYSRLSNTRCSRQSCRGRPRSCLKQPKQISFHNISLSNGTIPEKPLFRMSLARTNTNDRYEFLITDGNDEGAFKVKSSTRISRPTGVVYTAKELTGPKDYIIDLTLKLNRGRRRSNFVSRLYIFVGTHDL